MVVAQGQLGMRMGRLLLGQQTQVPVAGEELVEAQHLLALVVQVLLLSGEDCNGKVLRSD
jgi:hypothetical protein